jgi:DnaJ-class molecular chaperone
VDPKKKREKRLTTADRQAFEVLGFEGSKPTAEIKAAYKSLVKLHHPDANGGDRGSEDRLRAIITAYTHLKQKGFV